MSQPQKCTFWEKLINYKTYQFDIPQFFFHDFALEIETRSATRMVKSFWKLAMWIMMHVKT